MDHISKAYKFDRFLLDVERRLLLKDGEAVHLPLKTFDILLLLIENGPGIVPREKILTSVWGQGHLEADQTLSNLINRLRDILGDRSKLIIVTVPRVGYRFGVAVQVISPSSQTGALTVGGSDSSGETAVTGTVPSASFGLDEDKPEGSGASAIPPETILVQGSGPQAQTTRVVYRIPISTPVGGVQVRRRVAYTGGDIGILVSTDGRLAVSASRDKTLTVWDVESGRKLLRGSCDFL